MSKIDQSARAVAGDTPKAYNDPMESYGERIIRLEATEREYRATMRAVRILVNRLGGEVVITADELADEHWDLKAWRDVGSGNIHITVADLLEEKT